MNDLKRLKSYLKSTVDQYRIIHSFKKEIKYVKLFDDNDFAFITSEFYTVFVELRGSKFRVKSTDINYIIEMIEEWSSQHLSLDNFNFYSIDEYPIRFMNKEETIYNSFDFDDYKIWLDTLSEDVVKDGKQTFQYYAVVEKIQLIFEDIIINQYLTRSQMLHYDISKSCFIIRDTDIYITDKDKKTSYNVFDIKDDNFFKDTFNLKLSKDILSDLISSALANFSGEEILYSNSLIKENYLGQFWINKEIDLWVESMLIFDANGNPCKKINIVEKGKIVSFINSTFASMIFSSNTPSFDSFNKGEFGNYNKIKYMVKANTYNIDSESSIEKIVDSQAAYENNKLKVNAIIEILHNSQKKIINISFYLKDLFEVIKTNNEYYYITSDIFIND